MSQAWTTQVRVVAAAGPEGFSLVSRLSLLAPPPLSRSERVAPGRMGNARLGRVVAIHRKLLGSQLRAVVREAARSLKAPTHPRDPARVEVLAEVLLPMARAGAEPRVRVRVVAPPPDGTPVGAAEAAREGQAPKEALALAADLAQAERADPGVWPLSPERLMRSEAAAAPTPQVSKAKGQRPLLREAVVGAAGAGALHPAEPLVVRGLWRFAS